MSADTEAEDRPNTFNPAHVERWVGEIERHKEELLTKRMSYMAQCRPVRENISAVYELARNDGIPVKVLKAKIKERELERSIASITDAFEADEKESFEQLTQALGDFGELPLGRAALTAKAAEDGTEAPAADKPKRGRPKKVVHINDAGPVGEAVDTAAAIAGLDPRAGAETEDPTYLRGYDHAIAGGGCSIPSELCGLNRDRWHAGWFRGSDARKADGAADNVDRLAGIKGLPGADAAGKATLQ